jgi:hypothetical protein
MFNENFLHKFLLKSVKLTLNTEHYNWQIP